MQEEGRRVMQTIKEVNSSGGGEVRSCRLWRCGGNKETKTQIESIDYSSGMRPLQQSDRDRCRSNNAITPPTDL